MILTKCFRNIMTSNRYRFEISFLTGNAFETMKNYLASKPVLTIYSPRAETELHCDASASGFGGILFQK